MANQSSEASPVVSVQLSSGSFATSSIHLFSLEARKIAWRTRIVSPQDSKSYPGPFIVIDVSKKSEDGLSISVSPLLRFHNKTEFTLEARFQRPEQKQDESASVNLKPGDTFDDSIAAFDAISLSGGQKKALTSLAIGNFSFSFRPDSPEVVYKNLTPFTIEWSDELQGGKPISLSGIFDKLNYGVRRALSTKSVNCSFRTVYCSLKSKGVYVGDLHFLIQTIKRDIPIIQPDVSADRIENRNSPISLQEQREIYILPTMEVSNLLPSEAVILLTETDQCTSSGCNDIGKHATVEYGSTVEFYVNPAVIFFGVTLTAFGSSCKPVNSSEWVKKLQKSKNDVECLDVDLDFAGGKYCASLRLSRGERGILEAAIFTSYTLSNESDCALFFFPPNQKPLSRETLEKSSPNISPELGLYLPPKSVGSWFSRSHKVYVKLVEDRGVSKISLDLDALSGLTEISLETEDESGLGYITKFGLYVRSAPSKMHVPSQIITIVPRHLIINDSETDVIVQQCYLEDDNVGIISIKSKQKTALRLRKGFTKRRELHLFENFIKKHGNDKANPLINIKFRLTEANWTWSGPLCITSIGHFFVKFRQQSDRDDDREINAVEFASVNVTEEGSTLRVRFHKPPNSPLPYRIENCLRSSSFTYYQKDSAALDVLKPGSRVNYVWDDLTLPHKLVIIINDMHPLREVTLDKVRPWKPFFKLTQHRGLATHLMLKKKSKDQKTNIGELSDREMVKVGFEVYADGLTRVLRISESSDGRREDQLSLSRFKIQFRISQLQIHLLEHEKPNLEENPAVSFTPILVARVENVGVESVFTDQQNFNQICIQSLNMDHKWAGAPFAAMLRRHQSDSSDADGCLFKFVFVLLSSGSAVTQVKYSSIVLQPIDLNLDEETLMRIVPFWRTSLSTNSQSRQFYFDQFEIHPIKIIANFLPGDSYSSYDSAQETLRTLLHSVVKVPPIKNLVVELNGVLVTHALITTRELLVRCAQHYSWYGMRAIYIAKGSPLLPPAFASMFDDLASSSLDAFFDPSSGLVNIPGLTLGTFKLLSKCIDSNGFSGTKRYFGDLGKTLKTAGSNVVFAAVTEISDSVLKGAEMKGFDGIVSGFHQGVLKLAMEPSVLGTALMEGGPNRTIKLDRSPGVDESYIEGYLQAMLDTIYRQEYLRVKVIDDQVFLKNLPPSNSLIEEIINRVKDFLVGKGLLKGDPSTSYGPLRHLQGQREWKIGPTVLTLCEHLFVSYAIRFLRKQAGKTIASIKPKKKSEVGTKANQGKQKVRFIWRLGIGKFVLSGIVAYIDGRLCRCIPNPIARRIVSGFLLSFLDRNDEEE